MGFLMLLIAIGSCCSADENNTEDSMLIVMVKLTGETENIPKIGPI